MASFNIHAGMDGWGRRFDLVEACRRLRADVIALQEAFSPRDAPSQADVVGQRLGYEVAELPLARGWRRRDPIWAGRGWQPSKHLPAYQRALYVGAKATALQRRLRATHEEGTWGLAVLSRRPLLHHEDIELGKLRRDYTRRGALLVEVAGRSAPGDADLAPGRRLSFIVTHAAHLTAGSPRFFRALREELPAADAPAVLAGDMNLWGPPVSLLLPGWRRAVKGRTFPAYRPHSQVDHILVSPSVRVLEAEVVRTGNSDHRAVRARLRWD